ncbi:uncharacterized protein EAE97_000290 [Botrytis byssoidea]|uniref:Uncharacterized protein n=1 Tax=Botrytis byssoidea TaxID=139641 RepID=A0A9P5LZD4_9HELO|nr:uncharacterized protein EAE97_000290 [Botrytis byssoidea]KAF7955031.1 hypothetical protein EAE97_000290 [Botrytis byssoidea]
MSTIRYSIRTRKENFQPNPNPNPNSNKELAKCKFQHHEVTPKPDQTKKSSRPKEEVPQNMSSTAEESRMDGMVRLSDHPILTHLFIHPSIQPPSAPQTSQAPTRSKTRSNTQTPLTPHHPNEQAR